MTQERRADPQARLRKAYATLLAARALHERKPPLRDDAVNRASAAALQAVRALVDSQKESQPWDPTWRPGMPPPTRPKDPLSLAALHRLLARFHGMARTLGLASDFTDYVRTLVQDGLDADFGEAPEYDEDEARVAIDTAELLIYKVAAQIGMGEELQPSAPGRGTVAPAMSPDANKPPPPTRRSARVQHEVLVGVTSDKGTITGWGTNLSMGGVFVNASGHPPHGTKVSVIVQLPGLAECKLHGRVAWSQLAGPGVDEPGFGIEFIDADEPTRRILSEMVEKLSQDLARAPA